MECQKYRCKNNGGGNCIWLDNFLPKDCIHKDRLKMFLSSSEIKQ